MIANTKLQSWTKQHAIALSIACMVLLILSAIVLIAAINGLANTPSWWSKLGVISRDDPQIVQQGEQLENAITTQLTMVRDADDPTWSVAINHEQANAWLEARLISTITTHLGEDAWPTEIEAVRVGLDGDQMTLGALVAHASGKSVVWARVRLELDELGDLWATLSSVHVGTTPVPMSIVSAMSDERAVHKKYRVGAGRLELGDGRVGQLLALRVSNGRFELVMETK